MNVISKGIIERGTVEPRPITTADVASWIREDCWQFKSRLYTVTPGGAPGDPNVPNALLIDVADPTGPNGHRAFVVELTVREV